LTDFLLVHAAVSASSRPSSAIDNVRRDIEPQVVASDGGQ
jgi:hypothetical protein